MNKKDCRIIQDLLPNYIEKLTNDETNKFIEKHLTECKECDGICTNMKKNFYRQESKEKIDINFLKKYRKQLNILKIISFIILIIALIVMIYYYFYWRNAYLNAANQMIKMVEEDMYPDVFYATIETITEEMSGTKTLLVKGLEINDANHKGEYTFLVDEGSTKLKWREADISLNQLKEGQNIIVYSYREALDTQPIELTGVQMIVVLNDEI